MNFQESLYTFFNDFAESKEVKSVSAKLDYQTYFVRFKLWAKACILSHVLFSLFSIATGFGLIAIKLEALGGNLALIFAALLLLIIEAIKGVIWGNLFKGYFLKLTLSGKSSFPVLLGVIGAAFLALSVFLSANGAALSAQKIADNSTQISSAGKLSIDSLDAVYTAKIGQFEAAIKEIEKNKPTRWGGLLSNSENKQILNLQNRIESVESERKAAIQAANESTLKAIQANSLDATSAGEIMLYISLFNELLIIASMWFPWFYAYKVRQERDAITKGQSVDYAQSIVSMLAQNFGFGAGMIANSAPSIEAAKEPQKHTGLGFKQGRICAHEGCSNDISHRSRLAKYCNDSCKVAAWESRTGKKFIAGQKR